MRKIALLLLMLLGCFVCPMAVMAADAPVSIEPVSSETLNQKIMKQSNILWILPVLSLSCSKIMLVLHLVFSCASYKWSRPCFCSDVVCWHFG